GGEVGVRAAELAAAAVGLRRTHGDIVRGRAPGGADVGEQAHIGARAEAAARTGEDDGAHRLVASRFGHRLLHLVAHGGGPRVELLGTVQGDGCDAIVPCEEEVFVALDRSLVLPRWPSASRWCGSPP